MLGYNAIGYIATVLLVMTYYAQYYAHEKVMPLVCQVDMIILHHILANLSHYASIMLNAFKDLLCSQLCWHIYIIVLSLTAEVAVNCAHYCLCIYLFMNFTHIILIIDSYFERVIATTIATS